MEIGISWCWAQLAFVFILCSSHSNLCQVELRWRNMIAFECNWNVLRVRCHEVDVIWPHELHFHHVQIIWLKLISPNGLDAIAFTIHINPLFFSIQHWVYRNLNFIISCDLILSWKVACVFAPMEHKACKYGLFR